MINNSLFINKKILITGCTGFKGSWLSIWLNLLGAKIYGLALEPPTNPSLYDAAKLEKIIENNIIDIRESIKVTNLINKIRPDYIFHLAAQPLVQYSYLNPIETWQTNVIGTVNILDSLRTLDKKCIGIIITSDKCYENQEWVWGYRETDLLGGDDPYSASKGSAELAFKSYYKSFFSDTKYTQIRIASARAGNVIGGGDWAENRIVPDCIKAWSKDLTVEIKSPKSTRPFQHVLEPLSGYISLAEKLNLIEEINGQSFNFGPLSNANHKVIDVVKELSKNWERSKWEINTNKNEFRESKLLKLNCDKALTLLNWEPSLNFEKTMQLTSNWYFDFYNKSDFNVFEKCCDQIKEFCSNIKVAN
tara:strand:+ start:149 stop:1234 length:1086 start_codon:yes stop_codon:yes gene_type:complete